MKEIGLIIIFDTSGSMGQIHSRGKKRIEVAHRALLREIENLPLDEIKVGLKSFSNSSVRTNLALGDWDQRQLVEASTELLEVSGNTPLAQAITESVGELSKSSCKRQGILCLSDGFHNVKPLKMSDAFEAIRQSDAELQIGIEVSLVNIGKPRTFSTREFNQLNQDKRIKILDASSLASEEQIERTITSELRYHSAPTKAQAEVHRQLSHATVGNVTLAQELKNEKRNYNLFSALVFIAVVFTALLIFREFSKYEEQIVSLNGDIKSLQDSMDKMWELFGGEND